VGDVTDWRKYEARRNCPREGTEVISLTGDTSLDERHQELRNTIQGFKEKSAATEDELGKKLYALIISLLDFEEAGKHIDEKDWEIRSNIRFILFVAEKGEKLSLEDRLQAREQMRAYVDMALFPKNPDWEKAHIKILRGVPSFMLFRAVHICDLQDKFIDCMKEKLVPVDIRVAYNQ
jgi:hypothetical protein